MNSKKISAVTKKVFTFPFWVKAFMYVFLIDLSVVFLYPFLFMIVTSFKSPTDIMNSTVTWVISQVYYQNYESAFSSLHYVGDALKTVLYCALSTLGHILVCSFVGYGFARYNFKGKTFFFMMLILAMVVPLQTIIIPEYLLYAKLGMSSGFGPLVIPTWFGYGLKGALFIFIFRQFYLSLPKSLEEAAAVDGCTPVKTFFKIAFPSSVPPIIVSTVLSVVWHWNDYYEPGIYLGEETQMLLPMRLPRIFSAMEMVSIDADALLGVSEGIYTKGVAMAATFLCVLPILIFYLFFQKQFRQGIENSGITGE